MGNYLSQPTDSPVPVQNLTPLRKGKDGTLLVDPRSPSGNVDRTPLKVEESVKVLNDPRSPLMETNRTPIAVEKGKSKESLGTPSIISTKKHSRDQLRRHVLQKQNPNEKINTHLQFDDDEDDDEDENSDDLTEQLNELDIKTKETVSDENITPHNSSE